MTISGSVHNSLSSKPLPVLTALLKMIWQTQLGSLWWNNLEMGPFTPPDTAQCYSRIHKMHQAHSSKDQLPGGTDVTRSFCSKQGQLWGQMKLPGVSSLLLLKNVQGQSLFKFSVQPAPMLMQTCPGTGRVNYFLCTVRHYWAAKTTKGLSRILV